MAHPILAYVGALLLGAAGGAAGASAVSAATKKPCTPALPASGVKGVEESVGGITYKAIVDTVDGSSVVGSFTKFAAAKDAALKAGIRAAQRQKAKSAPLDLMIFDESPDWVKERRGFAEVTVRTSDDKPPEYGAYFVFNDLTPGGWDSVSGVGGVGPELDDLSAGPIGLPRESVAEMVDLGLALPIKDVTGDDKKRGIRLREVAPGKFGIPVKIERSSDAKTAKPSGVSGPPSLGDLGFSIPIKDVTGDDKKRGVRLREVAPGKFGIPVKIERAADAKTAKPAGVSGPPSVDDLGKRSDFAIFADSANQWAPTKVLPAAGSAFAQAAPAFAAMYGGGQAPQQAPPPQAPPQPQQAPPPQAPPQPQQAPPPQAPQYQRVQPPQPPQVPSASLSLEVTGPPRNIPSQ